MGSDLLESYCGSIVATAILGSSLPYFYDNPLALCVYNHLKIDSQCLATDNTGALRSFARDLCTAQVVDQYPTLTPWASNTAFIALPFLLALVGVAVGIIFTSYVHVKKGLTLDDKEKVMKSLLSSLRINIYASSVFVVIGAAALCWGLFGANSAFQDFDGFGNGDLPRTFIPDFTPSTAASLCSLVENAEGTLFPQGLTQGTGYYEPYDPLDFTYPRPDSVPWRLFVCILIGLVLGNLIGALTEYFTAGSSRPTMGIAQAGEFGAGAVIIKGLGVGMLSTVMPLLLVALSIVGAYNVFGTYGISLAAVGMLSTLAVTLSTDCYGPGKCFRCFVLDFSCFSLLTFFNFDIDRFFFLFLFLSPSAMAAVADNAGGIAEMAELSPDVRDRTDALDALGNTTAATGKGFSNGSAVLTAYALLTALVQDSALAPSPLELIPAVVGGQVDANGGALKHVSDYSVISLVNIYVVVSAFVRLLPRYPSTVKTFFDIR